MSAVTLAGVARVVRAARRRVRRRDPHLTTAGLMGPRGVRIALWWRTRREGALLVAPLRITGAGAPHALGCIRIGPRTRIGHQAWFSLVTRDARVDIGADCMLSASMSISVVDRVEIGDGTAIGERCLITDHGHDHLTYVEPAVDGEAPPRFNYDTTEPRPVRIGPGVHLGANVYVGPGVTIGEGAVVGVGSVVTRSVPPYTVVAGAPARPIRSLHPEDAGAPPCSPS